MALTWIDAVHLSIAYLWFSACKWSSVTYWTWWYVWFSQLSWHFISCSILKKYQIRTYNDFPNEIQISVRIMFLLMTQNARKRCLETLSTYRQLKRPKWWPQFRIRKFIEDNILSLQFGGHLQGSICSDLVISIGLTMLKWKY